MGFKFWDSGQKRGFGFVAFRVRGVSFRRAPVETRGC